MSRAAERIELRFASRVTGGGKGRVITLLRNQLKTRGIGSTFFPSPLCAKFTPEDSVEQLIKDYDWLGHNPRIHISLSKDDLIRNLDSVDISILIESNLSRSIITQMYFGHLKPILEQYGIFELTSDPALNIHAENYATYPLNDAFIFFKKTYVVRRKGKITEIKDY